VWGRASSRDHHHQRAPPGHDVAGKRGAANPAPLLTAGDGVAGFDGADAGLGANARLVSLEAVDGVEVRPLRFAVEALLPLSWRNIKLPRYRARAMPKRCHYPVDRDAARTQGLQTDQQVNLGRPPGAARVEDGDAVTRTDSQAIVGQRGWQWERCSQAWRAQPPQANAQIAPRGFIRVGKDVQRKPESIEKQEMNGSPSGCDTLCSAMQ
jgi:hypothetical protein